MIIRSKKTGETKEVTPEEARTMGISLPTTQPQAMPTSVSQLGPQQEGDNPLMYKLAQAQKLLGESSALPVAGGVLGFGIGGPPSAGFGAALGEQGKQSLAQGKQFVPGVPDLKDLPQIGKSGVIGWGTALSLLSLLGLGKAGLQPGKTREIKAEGKVIPRDVFQEKILAQPEKAVTQPSAQKTREYASSLYQKAFPYETTKEGTIAPAKEIDLNKFYKLLDTFEKETKTYSEGKPIANVEAGRISTASRALANEYGGKAVRALNDYMSFLHKAKWPLRILGGGFLSRLGWDMYNKIKGE